jgi:broad specificity phosphatase PhoE
MWVLFVSAPLAAALVEADAEASQQQYVVGAEGALSTWPGAGVEMMAALGREARPERPRATEVEITWIRHALSCANVNDQYSSKAGHAKYIHAKYNNIMAMLDPPLSDYGVHSSLRAGDQVRNVTNSHLHDGYFDIVASSSLLRAIETASLEFPDHRVLVLPFVSEVGLGKDNEVSSREVQSEKMAFVHELLQASGFPSGPGDVDYHLLDKSEEMWADHSATVKERLSDERIVGSGVKKAFVRMQRHFGARGAGGEKVESAMERNLFADPAKPNMDHALSFIARYVVPRVDQLRTLKRGGMSRTGPVKLAIASHSHFIAHSLAHGGSPESRVCAEALKGRSKPRNNEALTVKYVMVESEYGPTLEEKFLHAGVPRSSCVQAAAGATDKPDASEGLCREEYERCVASYESDLMQVAPCRREREEKERAEAAEAAARAAEDGIIYHDGSVPNHDGHLTYHY